MSGDRSPSRESPGGSGSARFGTVPMVHTSSTSASNSPAAVVASASSLSSQEALSALSPSGSLSSLPPGSPGSGRIQTNLFINYLPPEVDDAGLRKLFEPFGHIQTCKVLLDLATGQSKCFGFVKYQTREEAEAAISAMNGARVGNSGKTLVVKLAETSNDSLGTPWNNVYIKGLPPQFGQTELEGLFAPYGKIVESKLLRDAYTNASRGMAFVRFLTLEEAKSAIASLNNCVLPGALHPLVVKFADTDEERLARKQKQQRRRMGRGAGGYGLPAMAPLPALEPPGFYLSSHALLPVGVMHPMLSAADAPGPDAAAAHYAAFPAPHYHPAYYHAAVAPGGGAAAAAASVSMSSDRNATEVAELSRRLAGVSVGAADGPADASSEHSQQQLFQQQRSATALFVYNVPDAVDDGALAQLFSQCGRVLSARVVRDKQTRVSRRFAFVEMASLQEAQLAIQRLNGAQMHSHALSVSFKK